MLEPDNRLGNAGDDPAVPLIGDLDSGHINGHSLVDQAAPDARDERRDAAPPAARSDRWGDPPGAELSLLTQTLANLD